MAPYRNLEAAKASFAIATYCPMGQQATSLDNLVVILPP